MELVAGVLLHLVLGAAEVHRQRYATATEKLALQVAFVAGQVLTSRFHTDCHAER